MALSSSSRRCSLVPSTKVASLPHEALLDDEGLDSRGPEESLGFDEDRDDSTHDTTERRFHQLARVVKVGLAA